MIAVDDLVIEDASGRAILDGVSLRVAPGERVGIVGESGAGKTTLGLALIGATRPGLRVASGSVRVNGLEVVGMTGRPLRHLRRHQISYLSQDPASALTPTVRVRGQIRELAGAGAGPEVVGSALDALGLPSDDRFQRRFPHQLSGGQRQRLALARATAGGPEALILDEPTTGLDPAARQLVVEQMDDLARRRGLALIVVTHDLAAAASSCDRVLVMRDGAVIEEGPAAELMTSPGTPYAKELVLAVPTLTVRAREQPDVSTTVTEGAGLRVERLSAGHRDGPRRRLVVEDLSFTVGPRECVALVGRSGSGKTTVGRSVAGTHRRDAGRVLLDGVDLASDARRRTVDQRRRIQVIPQHSTASMNPRRTVGAAIARPLRKLFGLTAQAAQDEAGLLLSSVGLSPSLAGRYPRQLSGGQAQRVTIARALAARPDLIICDEMTSNLDMRAQAAVLQLIDDLRSDLGLAVLLITHDLGVTARMADRVLLLDEARACLPIEEFVAREVASRNRTDLLPATEVRKTH